MAIESVTGLAPRDAYDSTACVSASIPVAAVNPAGFPTINSGSLIETSGVFLQLTITNLIFLSVLVITLHGTQGQVHCPSGSKELIFL